MSKRVKLCLALFLAFAVIVQYSFSPQVMIAYGEDGDTITATEASDQTEPTQATTAPKPAPEPSTSSDSSGSSGSSDSSDATEPTESTEASDDSDGSGDDANIDAEDPTTVDEEALEEEEEEGYPAQDFSGSANGVSVKVSAPKGALPEGTDMSVSGVSADEVQAAVEGVVDGDVAKLKAVDISFRCDGKEIEPKKAVSVHMTASGVEADKVVHIADSGSANVVGASTSGSSASFKSDDFSVYIVVDEEEQSADVNAIATYEFYVGEDLKSTQRIKSGDKLLDPGTLGAGDGATSIFKGWYVKTGQDIEGETAGSELVFGTKSIVPKTEIIKIEAKIQTTYYVTFLGEKLNGARSVVAVDTVTVDGPKETPGTLDISSRTVVPKADTSAFEGWTEEDDGTTIIDASTPITVTDSKTLYAKVVDANWIHFSENVDWDTVDSEPSYTAPVFVKKTDNLSDKEPTPPTRKGYDFGGWYRDKACTEANKFEWSGTGLQTDITLYAKWVPAKATYTVIIWKQKVTDDKGAADDAKTYDFEASEQLTGTTGQELNEADFASYTTLEYTGFHYSNRIVIEPGTVKADGTTIVNVYYDRNLLTIYFIDGSHIEYEETTDNWGTQYGLVDGEYVRLDNNNGRWSYEESGNYEGTFYHQTNSNSGTQYGEANGQLVQLTRQGNNWYANGQRYYGNRYVEGEGSWGQVTYGVVNDTLTALNRDWWTGNYTYSITHEYTGIRYKAQTVPTQTPYTGLYGQTLEQNGYSWPSERDWYQNPNSGGTRLTFLDAFKFEGLSGVSEGGTVLTQYGANPSGSYTINFYKQTIDEKWPTTPTNSVSARGGTFTITEKYEGFKAVQYRNNYTGGWVNGGAGTSNVRVEGLEIRFERNKYNLTFVSDGDTVGTKTGIPYEDDMSNYQIDDPEKKHYKFVCWCEDPEGVAEFDWNSQMPAANKVLYAKWEPVQYRVTLDPDGGTIDLDKQDDDFNVDVGTEISKEALFQCISYDNKHELVGWFYKTGPKAGSVYDYGPVEEDVNLIAKWRMPGQVSIIYDAGEGGSLDGQPDTYKYATDSAVVLVAPPEVTTGYTFVGWQLKDKNNTLLDKVYYPGNTFTIKEDLIQNYSETTKTGEIHVVAKYIKPNEGPYEKTYIRWFANDGTDCFHMDTLDDPAGNKEDSTLLVNTPVAIQGIPDAPTRAGYDFLGWAKVEEADDIELEQDNLKVFIYYKDGKFFSDEDCTNEVSEVAADNIIEGRKYEAMFAVWCPKTYTVKYTDGVEGDTIFNDETHSNLTVGDTTPKFNHGTDPTRDGYDFNGWDPAYTTELAIDEADENNVITYTAKWTEKTVTINYASADETMGTVTSSSETVTLTGDAEGSVATPAEGFEFVSWTKNGVVVSTEASFIPKKVDGKNVAATYVANFKKATEPDRLSIEISTAQKNATYNGSKQENGYTLIYKINGNVVSKGDFPSEATVTEPDKRVAAGTNVGNYEQPVKVTLSAPEESGYIIDTPEVTATVKLNITPATLTITAENKSKIYGEADPELTAKVEGLCGSDTVKYDLTRDAGEAVGKYTIRVSLVEAASVEAGSMELHANAALDPANYNIKLVNGTLTITAPTPDDVTPTPTPNNPGGGNAVATVLPAAAPIVDTPVPTTIDEPAPPKAVNAYWALINLLCAIATALLSLIMLIRYFGKRKDEEELTDPATGERVTRDVEEQRGGLARIASLIPAIGGIIAFLLTEDMSLPMAMVDKWTVLMIVILAIQAGVGIVAKLRDEKDDEDEEAMA